VLIRTMAARWPAIAAVALAAVLAHSSVGHFRNDVAIRQHYRDALGTADAALWIGLLQCVAAIALCVPRTRVGAAWSIVAVVVAATLWRVVRTASLEGLLPAIVVTATALAIAVGGRPRPGAVRTR
jgi:hypothetical protein